MESFGAAKCGVRRPTPPNPRFLTAGVDRELSGHLVGNRESRKFRHFRFPDRSGDANVVRVERCCSHSL